jgi:hypothetical protein
VGDLHNCGIFYLKDAKLGTHIKLEEVYGSQVNFGAQREKRKKNGKDI